MQIGVIGEPVDLTYDYQHLGSTAAHISKAAATPFGKAMKGAKKPMVIVGPGILRRTDHAAVMKDIIALAEGFGAFPASALCTARLRCERNRHSRKACRA